MHFRFEICKYQNLYIVIYKSKCSVEGSHSNSSQHSTDLTVMASCKCQPKPILEVKKGKYFKNKRAADRSSSVIETDGETISFAINQWFWKNNEVIWKQFSTEINENINKCCERNSMSTVIVKIEDQS